MPWKDLVGHKRVIDRFRQSYENNRLANTYLFVGPEGVGKRKFALEFAKALFCTKNDGSFDSCEDCPQCLQVSSHNHPDLILISKPADKNYLPIELFVGDREHRRQSGLCHDINLTPFSGKRKIAIIDDADRFNLESANSLLKTLEEPPNNSIIILLGTSEHRQLPTILSRCQVVRFGPLSDSQVVHLLEHHEVELNVPVDQLSQAADGSISRALELNDQELFNFREDLLARLAMLDPADQGFAKTICDYVDGYSKEGAVRRKQMVLLGDLAITFYAQTLRQMFAVEDDGVENQAVDQIISQLDVHQLAAILPELIERTIQFQKHVDSNMAASNIIPAWLNDLGAIARQQKRACLA